MPYIERDNEGRICGLYANPQPGRAEVWHEETDGEVGAFRNRHPLGGRLPNLEPDQFWFGLRVAGYEDDVRAWVASLNDPESPFFNPVEWASASAKLEFAKFFERDHPLVLAAQQAIGISEAELDALWLYALG